MLGKDKETSMGISIHELLKLEIKVKFWQLGIMSISCVILGAMLK